MCETAKRCRDLTCEGFCSTRSALWQFMLKICPNLSVKMGEFSSLKFECNSVLRKMSI